MFTKKKRKKKFIPDTVSVQRVTGVNAFRA